MAAPPETITEEQVQQDLVRLDAYRGQLNAMVQQYQYLVNSRGDHLRARETLEGLDRVDPGAELLVPIGGDAFVRGTAKKDEKVFLGVGAGVIVELERPKVSEVLAERIQKIDQASGELEGQIRQLEDRIQLLTQRLDSVTRSGPDSGDPRDRVVSN
jgi:prefoldin alpha subunit